MNKLQATAESIGAGGGFVLLDFPSAVCSLVPTDFVGGARVVTAEVVGSLD